CDVSNPTLSSASSAPTVTWTNTIVSRVNASTSLAGSTADQSPGAASPAASPSPDQVTDSTQAGVTPATGGQSSPSQPLQTAVGAPLLEAPSGVSAGAQDGHVTITWQAVSAAAAYRIYRSGAYVGTTSAVSFTDVTGGVG